MHALTCTSESLCREIYRAGGLQYRGAPVAVRASDGGRQPASRVRGSERVGGYKYLTVL